MKKLVLFLSAILLALQAHTAQLAFIVLNTANWGAGRLPSDWQIKVKDGRPDISVCTESEGSCLHLRSQKASFALEHGVNVDPVQMPAAKFLDSVRFRSPRHWQANTCSPLALA